MYIRITPGSKEDKEPKDALSKTAEDYLEVMYVLEKTYGRIRIKDIAERLGIKPSSVIEYLKRLTAEGLVYYKPGTRARLTDKGRKIAEKIYERHKILKEFLVLIGVPEEIADMDACYIEHGIHPETLKKIVEFIKKCHDQITK